MNLQNKNVWITGASSGIGEGLAIEFAKKGANLILSSNQPEELERVKKECDTFGVNTFVYPFDLGIEKEIIETAKKVIDEVMTIDILVNNGGISQRSLVTETPVDIDRKIMETDFFGTVILTKQVLPLFVKQNKGHIVVMSSVVGKFGFPLRSAYSAAKHALHGFFEALRAEMVKNNVKVLLVCPGKVQTNISLHALTKDGKTWNKMDKSQEKGMPVDKCARRIISAIKRNRKELFLGGKEIIMVFIRNCFPRLFYYLAPKVKTT